MSASASAWPPVGWSVISLCLKGGRLLAAPFLFTATLSCLPLAPGQIMGKREKPFLLAGSPVKSNRSLPRCSYSSPSNGSWGITDAKEPPPRDSSNLPASCTTFIVGVLIDRGTAGFPPLPASLLVRAASLSAMLAW